MKRQLGIAETSLNQESETTVSANPTTNQLWELSGHVASATCLKETFHKVRWMAWITLQVLSSLNILLFQLCSSSYKYSSSKLAGPERALKEEKYNKKFKIIKDLSLQIMPNIISSNWETVSHSHQHLQQLLAHGSCSINVDWSFLFTDEKLELWTKSPNSQQRALYTTQLSLKLCSVYCIFSG